GARRRDRRRELGGGRGRHRPQERAAEHGGVVAAPDPAIPGRYRAGAAMTDDQSLPETALDLSLDALSVGYTATIAWTAENAEIDAFAAVSGDYNPLHMDPAYATSLGFADRVSHGMLLGAKLSGFIGMVLPG